MSDNVHTELAKALIDNYFPNTNPKIKERLIFIALIGLPGGPDVREKLQLPFLEFLAKVYEAYPNMDFGQSIATADSSTDFLLKISRAVFLPDKQANPYFVQQGPPAPASLRN